MWGVRRPAGVRFGRVQAPNMCETVPLEGLPSARPVPFGRLLLAIEGYSGHFATRAALRLAPLVFLRPAELRGAVEQKTDTVSYAALACAAVARTSDGAVRASRARRLGAMLFARAVRPGTFGGALRVIHSAASN